LIRPYFPAANELLCYTRSTASYKLLSEYNLVLTQRLKSYPLVLVALYCGSSRFAMVTNELPLGVLWLLCVAGTSLARSTAQLSCPLLSLPTHLSESKPTAYIDYPAALPLYKVSEGQARLLLCSCSGIEVWDSTVQSDS
jgi:hypothetical protein